MALEERLENEYKVALKARDEIKVSTIRMLKADINKLKLDSSKNDLGDGDILKVIQRQAKQRRDSIEQFEKGKREDLAAKEKKELEILLSYMPEQCSPEELKKMAEETIKELGATEKKDMGNVIKAMMERLKGRAEGKEVSRIVSSLLELKS